MKKSDKPQTLILSREELSEVLSKIEKGELRKVHLIPQW